MGICGLLKALKSITEQKHVREFSGQTCCVDSYSWLHKGSYSCSTDICRKQDFSQCIFYCIKRIELLRAFGVEVIMVLDGGFLPMKGETEKQRHGSRERNRKEADELYELGNRSAADGYYKKAVDVSPEMAKALIDELTRRKIRFVVAPYEADAQLADLCMRGIADFAVTEDSDSLVFGCKRVLFKLDNDGNGQMIDMANLQLCRSPNMAAFSTSMFLNMCILAGCDYLASPKGVGIMTAHKLVMKYKQTKRLLRGIRLEGYVGIPTDYDKRFFKARLTFLHHKVWRYSANEECIEPLNIPIATDELTILDEIDQKMDFAGPNMNNDIARQIAYGHFNPLTKLPYNQGTKNSNSVNKVHEREPLRSIIQPPNKLVHNSSSETTVNSKYFKSSVAQTSTPIGKQPKPGSILNFTAKKDRPPQIERSFTLTPFMVKKSSANSRNSHENAMDNEAKSFSDGQNHSEKSLNEVPARKTLKLQLPSIANKNVESQSIASRKTSIADKIANHEVLKQEQPASQTKFFSKRDLFAPKMASTGCSNMFESFSFKESSISLASSPPLKRSRSLLNKKV